jgi:anti-sigma factor ChrR (cupin superfamily)
VESGNTADFFYMRASDGDWQAFSPGVQMKLLFTDSQTGRVTALVRMEPGTHLPRHQHLMVEELFVLEGDCHIASDQVLHAGDYFRAQGGSLHGATYTEAGTTFLTLCLNDFSA